MPILIVPLLFGLITALIASSKGRSWLGWYLLGFFFSPFILMFLFMDFKFTSKWNWKTGFLKWEKRKSENEPVDLDTVQENIIIGCPTCGDLNSGKRNLCAGCKGPLG
jgi:hypothetical protein